MDFFKFTRAKIHWQKAVTVYWIFGGPGTGKTKSAVELAQELAGDDYYTHLPGTLKWWDGYSGQRVAILDDFRRSDVSEIGGLAYLLRVLDRYDLSLEIKGGSVVRQFEYVIITCPQGPVDTFTYRRIDNDDVIDENIGQLIRRLYLIVELRPVGGVVTEIDHTATLKRQYCLDDSIRPLQR